MTTITNVKLSEISCVMFYVQDVNKAVSFYRDVLGSAVKFQDDCWAELETGAATLALHKEEPSKVKPSGTCVFFNVDDVLGTYEALKSKGVKFDQDPQVVCEIEDKVGKAAKFKDLDGNSLSIFGYVKK